MNSTFLGDLRGKIQMAIARDHLAGMKRAFTEDLCQRDRDVKRTSFMMFIFAIGVFVGSMYVFYFFAGLIESFRSGQAQISPVKFVIGYLVVFIVLTILGRLLIPKPPMKLHGGGSYYLETDSKLSGKGPISVILRGLFAFPNWIRVLIGNFLESRRAVFDDRMINLAILFLTNLDMKKPVDDMLWQGHGYSREERLYILGKLMSLGYLWLQRQQDKVYAVRSYITDDILKKAERQYERRQDKPRGQERD